MMVDIVEQLCIKSFNIKSKTGQQWTAKQGKIYTTSVPSEKKDTVTVFSNYWIPVPKDHFVKLEE